MTARCVHGGILKTSPHWGTPVPPENFCLEFEIMLITGETPRAVQGGSTRRVPAGGMKAFHKDFIKISNFFHNPFMLPFYYISVVNKN
jgi:hypothetical protein